MDVATALSLRLRSLLLAEHPGGALDDVAGVTAWFGALQAQDLNSVLWSLGARLPGRSLAEVVAETERRDVVRTWPMRGTVHLVPSVDAHWMLETMGVRALAGAAKRRAQIGLSERDADRAVEILGAALKGGGRMTRSRCVAALVDGGVPVSGQIGYHLLWYASQRGVTAIAPNEGAEQTFVLLDEWAPGRVRLSRPEALARIARRYFRGHGPTTLKDFAGWTGLAMGDCRAGVAEAGLAAVRVDGVEMWADPAVLEAGPVTGWWALPGFDEYLLGYKDRSMMMEPAQLAAVVPGGNGVFRSTLVRDGRVVATWKRTLGVKAVTVAVEPLERFTEDHWAKATEALEPYAEFLGLPLRVKRP